MRRLWTPLTLAAIVWAWGTLALAPVPAQRRGPSVDPSRARARARTFSNPAWGRDFPDPFILRAGGRFYAYATATSGYDFQVMESPDLVHWTHRGSAFRPGWAQWDYWAPETVAYRGRYYLTYSARNPQTGRHDIGIAAADSPLGPFREIAVLVRADQNRVGVIDATVFLDRDRTPYLVYSEEDPRRIVLRRMSQDLTRVNPGVTELVRPDRPSERGITEAPTLMLRRGVYHLFFSVGWFQSNKGDACYAVCHARATSVHGPYVKDQGPVLQSVQGRVYGPGHQCVVTLQNGDMWMAYHAWDDRNEPRYGSNPSGRTLRIDPLVWLGDTPVVRGPSTDPQPAPRLGP